MKVMQSNLPSRRRESLPRPCVNGVWHGHRMDNFARILPRVPCMLPWNQVMNVRGELNPFDICV